MLPFVVALVVAAAGVLQPLRPPSPSLVFGRVIDAGTGRPIAGAIVTLNGSAAVPSRSGGSTPLRVMTNAHGEFVARGLRKGTLFLNVTKGGYVDATRGQRRPGGSTQPLPIGEGKRITDVEIRMWRHAVITGTVIDEAGDPVVGARVQAYRQAFVAGYPRFLPGATSTTDDRGVYRLAGLTPGDFQVAVASTQLSMPTGVVDTLLQRDVGQAFRPALPGNDAQVALLSREAGGIGAAVAPPGTPFAIEAGGQTISLAAGTASPVAAADGSFLVYPTTFFPSATSSAQGAVVRVRSGEERGNIDLQMQPVRAVRLSGMLLAPEGYAAHVAVRLFPAADDRASAIETATTMSDAAGAFSFPAVPPGQYVLRVVRLPRPPIAVDDSNHVTIVRSGNVSISASALPSAGPPPPPPIPADATLCAEVPVAVGDMDVSGMAVLLRTGLRISGRVEFDGSGDRADPATLANLRIMLDPADGTSLSDEVSLVTGRIDGNGQFTTYGVPPGKYFVRVGGLPGWFFKGALYEGRDLADVPVDLGPSDVSGVVLTFTDTPSSIAGTVRDGQIPDETAVVFAFPMDNAEWLETGMAPRRLRTARANRDGAYLFPALPPGDYYLVAVKEDFVGEWQDPEFLESISRSAQQVHVIEGERSSLDLRTSSVR